MNKFKIFTDSKDIEYQIIIFEDESDLFFRANDIGTILGLTNVSKAINNINSNDKKQFPYYSNGNLLLSYYLNEIGVYSLLGASRKENSLDLMKWINVYSKKYLIDKYIESQIYIVKPYFFVILNCNSKLNNRYLIKATKKDEELYILSAMDNFKNGKIENFIYISNPKYTKKEFNKFLQIILKDFKSIKKNEYKVNPELGTFLYAIINVLNDIGTLDAKNIYKKNKSCINNFTKFLIDKDK